MTLPFRDYQTDTVEFIMDRLYAKDLPGAGGLLDPGLGKTRIALEVIRQLQLVGEVENVLLVAPLRVLELVWPEENKKWGYNFDLKWMKKSGPQPFITMCSPDNVHNVPHHRHFDLLLIDESSLFKSWTTKRMKNMKKLIRSIAKRLILTGTPCHQSLSDLHGQMFIVDNGDRLGKNVTVFRDRYMKKGGWCGRQWLMRDKVEDELLALVSQVCYRLDDSVLKMPELQVNDVYCTLPASALKIHNDMKKLLAAAMEDQTTVLAANAAAAYGKLRQIANGVVKNINDDSKESELCEVHTEKLKALKELCGELQGKKMVVFYHYTADADRITAAFPNSVRIGGGSDALQAITNWKHLLLVQIRAGGYGLNLQTTGCQDVVFYGLGDSVEQYEQGYRRVYRQGNDEGFVRIHRLLCKGTVDTVIRDRLDGRLTSAGAFLKALKAFAEK